MTGSAPGHESTHALYAQPVVRIRQVGTDPAAAGISDLTKTPPCPVCGGTQAKAVFALPGTRFRTVQCTACGLGSLFPRPVAEEISGFYPPQYYGAGGQKFAGLIEALVRLVGARHARFFARQIAPGGRILDVGCGRGVTLHALADAGFECWGFEVSAAAIEGVDARIRTRVGETLADASFPDQFFNEVILWHVVEHIPEPAETLAEVHRILRPGGVVIVAVPNFSSWQACLCGPAWFHLDPPRHLFHFPLAGLHQLLEKAGFRCLSTHHFSLRQNPFGWIQSLLNLAPWLPRNGLYAVLHHSGAAGSPFSPFIRIQLRFLGLLLAPAAVLLSIAAAICRRGATVHVVGVRRQDKSPEKGFLPIAS